MELNQNLAQHLLSLVDKFIFESSKTSATGLQVWMAVFDANEVTIFGEICAFQKLLKSIENKINCESDVIQKNKYLEWVQPFESCMSQKYLQQGAGATISQCFNKNGRDFFSLEMCSEVLSRNSPESYIESEVLIELTSEANSIFDEISIKIDNPELKLFLCEIIQIFNFGISAYRIKGVDGIDEAIALILGKLVLKKKAGFEPTENSKGIVEKIKKLLHKGLKASEIAKNTAETLAIGYEVIDKIVS
jgi:hypothetical protein